MNLDDDVVNRCLRFGPLHQRHNTARGRVTAAREQGRRQLQVLVRLRTVHSHLIGNTLFAADG